MAAYQAQPPRKKRKVSDEGEGENSASHPDSIALTIAPGEVIEDITKDSKEDNKHPWNAVTGDEELSHDPPKDSEANLGSEFQDLLDSTEEVVGDPVDPILASVLEQTWGKCLLSAEKRKELWKGIDIPSNCKILKAPDLNTKIQIRIVDNAWKKDRAARDRQKGLSRAAIPALYGMGNLSKTKADLAKCYKLSASEPKTLDEAKKCLEAIKKHTKDAHEMMTNTSKKLQQTVRVLAYDYTATTKKRKLDVCSALGTAFNPYSQDTKTSEEYLFNDDTMKLMKNELNAIKPKNKGNESTSTSDSKNGNHSGKSQRSGQSTYQGNAPKKNFNSSGNYSSNNNKNQQNLGKFKQGKKR